MGFFISENMGHYKGELGKFEYNTEEFELITIAGSQCLHYIGNGKDVRLPKGCKNCQYMFIGYTGKYLDLSEFYTDDVVSMKYMFAECRNLEEIDLSNFNTEKVKQMNLMFKSCTNLKCLDLSMFNVNNVRDMSGLCLGCLSLQSIDISDIGVINFAIEMFKHCNKLSYIKTSVLRYKYVTLDCYSNRLKELECNKH